MMNWPRMSFRLAPRDFRMPISRVRSDTDTSIMFIMPMPPIVGVLTESAESRKGTDDDQIIIPYTNAMYNRGKTLGPVHAADKGAGSVGHQKNRLLKIFGDDDYYMVVTSAEMLDMMNTMMGTMMEPITHTFCWRSTSMYCKNRPRSRVIFWMDA